MSNEVVVRDVEVQTVPTPKPADVLARVVDAVRRDSQETPETFLKETAVPHGGE